MTIQRPAFYAQYRITGAVVPALRTAIMTPCTGAMTEFDEPWKHPETVTIRSTEREREKDRQISNLGKPRSD